MIAHLQGIVELIEKNTIVLDVSGVGYEIRVSKNVVDTGLKLGDQLRIYTHQIVKEDELSLYGFISIAEKSFFNILLSVSGIGSKTALNIIDSIEKAKMINAVLTNDLFTISSLPGIGKKTAERLVLELKDKFAKEQPLDIHIKAKKEEITIAGDALKELGYNSREIASAFNKAEQELQGLNEVEKIIKVALKYL